MPKYLMALDSGTTSARCLIFDSNANVVSMSQRSIPQYFPQPAWVEQDANEIWARQLSVCVEAMQKQSIQASDIAGIGITNQRESVVVWDRNTGDPIAPVIVWQCRRTCVSEYKGIHVCGHKQRYFSDTERGDTQATSHTSFGVEM